LVEPADSFLVAVNFEGIADGDSVAIFQSVRQNIPQSSIYIRKNGTWTDFKKSNSVGYTGALAIELIACNVSNQIKDTTIVDNPLEVKLFPNPTIGRVEIAANSNITVDMITVYNLRGQQIPYKSARLTPRKIEINLAGNSPGIYLIRVLDGNKHFSGKIFLGAH
jgi:lysyl endopeptidase